MLEFTSSLFSLISTITIIHPTLQETTNKTLSKVLASSFQINLDSRTETSADMNSIYSDTDTWCR